MAAASLISPRLICELNTMAAPWQGHCGAELSQSMQRAKGLHGTVSSMCTGRTWVCFMPGDYSVPERQALSTLVEQVNKQRKYSDLTSPSLDFLICKMGI